MWWPSPSDYQDAVQNPRVAFSEIELRDGLVVCDTLGLPKPISGSFATVYQVDYQGRRHAVRCFLRHVPDIAQRYAAISAYLKKAALPYAVEFSFLPQGIRLRGQWFPIVKMDWVEGNRLDVYIAQHLNDSTALLEITRQFLQLAESLRRANIAHGDLQHGNLLVVNHQLRLLDYDGMFVPTLSGRPSNELGQPNYQHPMRSSRDYGPYLDNFSVWVITLSLLGLALDPDLRYGFAGGGEALLLEQTDFVNPARSHVLTAMLQSPHPTLRFLTQSFLKLLGTRDLSAVPPLEPSALAVLNTATPARANLPDWLRERMVILPDAQNANAQNMNAKNVNAQSAPAQNASSQNSADWLLDHLQPNAPARIDGSFRAEKSMLILTIVALLFITGAMFLIPVDFFLGIALLFSVGMIGAGTLKVGFSLRYNTPERRNAARDVEQLEQEHIELDDRLRELSAERAQMDRAHQDKLAKLKRDLTKASVQEQTAQTSLQQDLKTLAADYDAQRSALANEQAEALANALQEYRTKRFERMLEAFRIADAALPIFLNRELKTSLAMHGFVTAADIINFQVRMTRDGPRFHLVNRHGKAIAVPGLSAKQGVPLLLWRRNKEAHVRALIPTTLPSEYEAAVLKKFQAAKVTLQLEEIKKKQALEQNARRVTEKARAEQARLAREIQELPTQSRRVITSAEQELAQLRKALAEKEWALILARRKLESFAHINFVNYVKAILGR